MRWFGILLLLCLGLGCQGTRSIQYVPVPVQRYRFVSDRDIAVQWDLQAPGADGTTHTQERLEWVMRYEDAGCSPEGLCQLRVTCESVETLRTRVNGTVDTQGDAVETLEGRSFVLTLDEQGLIVDRGDMVNVLREVVDNAFREDPKQGRVKMPDMIWDVITGQWSWLDVLQEGVIDETEMGGGWSSVLPVPTPWVSRQARKVLYRMEGVEQTENGKVALIRSDFSLSPEKVPADWPIPYAGTFRQSGTFGFLKVMKIHELEGQGEERWNLDKGLSEGYDHQYRYEAQALMPLNPGGQTLITVEQCFTMTLLEAIDNKELVDDRGT